MKKRFSLLLSQYEIIKHLSDEKLGILFRACYESHLEDGFFNTEFVPDLNGDLELETIWRVISMQFIADDYYARKYFNL